jgi:imidazolonepropionase-like amidohydrolase
MGLRTRLLVLSLGLLSLAVACGGDGNGATDSTQTATPRPTAQPSAAALRSPEPPTPRPEVLIVQNGALIDGTGADPVPNAYVVIEGSKIASVGSGQPPAPSGARIVDARGGTILPGLSDSHVHVARGVPAAGQPPIEQGGLLPWLTGGITHLRDVATPPGAFPSVRIAADALTMNHEAPRIFWAGPMVTAPGGYPISVPRYRDVGQEVSGIENVRALVNQLADGGARLIKLGLDKGYYSDEGWPLLSVEEVRAITETAHARGLLVTAHVTSLDEVRLALDGGVDDLAHAPLELLPDDMIGEMLRKGTTMATTASVWGDRAAGARAAANARRYMQAGGVVALATDFGCCGQPAGTQALLGEMQFLIGFGGFTPMQVLVAATRNGPIVSGLRDEAGTIEAGKLADLIVVEGNPLFDLQALTSVRLVVQGGRVVVEEA